MSHLLHAWEAPLPSSLAEAIAIRDRLVREGGAPGRLFPTLAARLTAQHPDIDALDDEDDPGVWTDGPLAANGRGPVFGIGIQAHAAPVVVPFVVATARSLGLVILDEEGGLAFLPDGRVLGRDVATAAAVPVAPPTTLPVALTRAGVRGALLDALAPRLAAAGFRSVPGGHAFSLDAPAARFFVSVDCESRDGDHDASLDARLVLPGTQPLALLQVLSPDPLEIVVRMEPLATAHGLAWPDASSASASSTGAARVVTGADIESLARHWLRVLDAALLPLIDRCSALHGLGQQLHEQHAWFGPNRVALVLAAVLGGHDLPAMAKALDARTTQHWHDRTREWLAFLQAPPLVDLGPPLADPDRALGALPMLKHGRPILPAGPEGMGPPFDEQPVVSGFAGGHYLVYGVEQGGAVVHVQQRHLSAIGCARDALHARSLANLAAAAEGRWRIEPEGPIQRLHLDGRNDASLLLAEALWQGPLAPHTPNGALVAVPTSGELLFCDVAGAGGLAALRARIASRKADGSALLTETVFHRRDRAWEPLPAPRNVALADRTE
ncbi:MAG: hypothetical protein ACK515_15955 [bacterium]|nr:hypothetical protein [Betaproteobacteria bacterium]